jgi:hypothetical protein
LTPLQPSDGPATILLGLSGPIATYGPLYDEGRPDAAAPAYRTLLIEWDGTNAVVLGERAYLVVPDASGFRRATGSVRATLS